MISKVAESGTTIPICKTEVVKDDLDPTWKPLFLNIQQIGSKVLKFLCQDFFFTDAD